jgi:phage repressor protein C with HTH and peptisase S24 domain
MDADIWRELSIMGSWITDATILRWAELTSEISNGEIRASQIIDHLLVTPIPERDVTSARGLYATMDNKVCVWSDKIITVKFDVDHAIPFALWKNNDLWNLLPADPKVNNQKRDKLPSHDLLLARKDCIVDYWEKMYEAFENRFEFESSKFAGKHAFETKNWENKLFAALTEATEITAIQRGIVRWEPEGANVQIHLQNKSTQSHSPSIKPDTFEERIIQILDIEDIRTEMFKSALPFAGDLAAGEPFKGFNIRDLNLEAEDMDWYKVPERLCRDGRFLIRVAGDSMEPTIMKGDYLVCEYHRHRQQNHNVVIMADFSVLCDGEVAVKRISESEHHWIFKSDNPQYDDIRLEKEHDDQYPILGTIIYNLTRDVPCY